MRDLIRKTKNLRQKAAELKTVLEQAPATVAQVREAVAATAGELHQLRSDALASVSDLKADTEGRLGEALQEINASQSVFLQAGFEVGGVNVDITPPLRAIVRLNKLEDVGPAELRSLMAANAQRKTTRAILAALLQADEMARKLRLTRLDYREVIVGVGAAPSIRVCWRAEEAVETGEVAEPAKPPSAPAPAPAPETAFTGSFFERRTPEPTRRPAAPPPAPIAPKSPPPSDEPDIPSPAGADWKREAFDRLKQSPRLSKYPRLPGR